MLIILVTTAVYTFIIYAGQKVKYNTSSTEVILMQIHFIHKALENMHNFKVLSTKGRVLISNCPNKNAGNFTGNLEGTIPAKKYHFVLLSFPTLLRERIALLPLQYRSECNGMIHQHRIYSERFSKQMTIILRFRSAGTPQSFRFSTPKIEENGRIHQYRISSGSVKLVIRKN